METEIKVLSSEAGRRKQYWEQDLTTDRNGAVVNSFRNLKQILDCDELLQGIRSMSSPGPWRSQGSCPGAI